MKQLVGLILAFVLFTLTGCTGIPQGIEPIGSFELERYLGTWYEIARLDHPFERGLSNVRATYSLREDGGVDVVNEGYSAAEQKWRQAEGIAYFVDKPSRGHLKVSFFGPFYGSYIIVELDRQNYRYALVCGPDRSYLWILARRPELPGDILRALVETAERLGFMVDQLIYVEHDRQPDSPETVGSAWNRRAARPEGYLNKASS